MLEARACSVDNRTIASYNHPPQSILQLPENCKDINVDKDITSYSKILYCVLSCINVIK